MPVGAVFSYALPVPTSPAGLLAACVARQIGSSGPMPLPPPLYVIEGRADLNTNAWATSKFGGGEWGVCLARVLQLIPRLLCQHAALAVGYPSGPGTPPILAVGIPSTNGGRSLGIMGQKLFVRGGFLIIS